jgi:hypothetical protein
VWMCIKSGNLGMESACVCRGVLRVWGMRIQDSRTDFGGFFTKMVGGTSTRGWCKIHGGGRNIVNCT